MSESTKVFVDIGVLVDFCSTHREREQKEAEITLDGIKDKDGRIIISKEASTALISRLTDRYRILNCLINKATYYLVGDWKEEGASDLDVDLETKYRAEALNTSSLNENIDVDITNHQDEIDELVQLLEEVGLSKFRELLDDYLQMSHGLRIKLDSKIIDDRFTSKRELPMAETLLKNIVEDDIQARSLLEAVFWNQETRNEHYLASSADSVYERRDEVNQTISNKFSSQSTLKIFSPREFIDEYIDDQYDPASISS